MPRFFREVSNWFVTMVRVAQGKATRLDLPKHRSRASPVRRHKGGLLSIDVCDEWERSAGSCEQTRLAMLDRVCSTLSVFFDVFLSAFRSAYRSGCRPHFLNPALITNGKGLPVCPGFRLSVVQQGAIELDGCIFATMRNHGHPAAVLAIGCTRQGLGTALIKLFAAGKC